MPNARPLTDNMRRVLEDLAAGRSAQHRMPGGRSAAGGFERVLGALLARRLIEWANGYRITDAGRAALGVGGPEHG